MNISSFITGELTGIVVTVALIVVLAIKYGKKS